MFRSTLPVFQPSRAFNGMGEFFAYQPPMNGLGEYFTPNALGEYFHAASTVGSPSMMGLGMIANPCSTGLCGLGADELPDGIPDGSGAGAAAGAAAGAMVVAAVVGIGMIVVGGWLGYQAGKAMSPPGKNWGVGGIVGGTILSPIALPYFGIMGAISNSMK
jgi:hypothetical protein